jgi:hypothetical protein
MCLGVWAILGNTLGQLILVALRLFLVGSALLWGFTHTELIKSAAHDWATTLTQK